jgi:endonuclease/exonuclease/phosphatase family metal-dependent hydrolase
VTTNEVHLEPLDDYRVAAHACLDAGGRTVDAYVTHLHHTAEGSAIRARQIGHLLGFIVHTRSAAAVLVAGDFNAPPNAPELQPLGAQFTDTYARLHPEQVGVLVSTLNPAIGHTPQRIDYIFAGAGSLQPVASHVFLNTAAGNGMWASDHFGVWTAFRWVDGPGFPRSAEPQPRAGGHE